MPVDAVNPKQMLMRLPSLVERAEKWCCATFEAFDEQFGSVTLCHCEDIVTQAVDNFHLSLEDEDENIRVWNDLLARLIAHVERKHPIS